MIAVVRARSVSNPVAWPFLLAGVETTDDPHGVHVIKKPHLASIRRLSFAPRKPDGTLESPS
jgi:hypothetical protein